MLKSTDIAHVIRQLNRRKELRSSLSAHAKTSYHGMTSGELERNGCPFEIRIGGRYIGLFCDNPSLFIEPDDPLHGQILERFSDAVAKIDTELRAMGVEVNDTVEVV